MMEGESEKPTTIATDVEKQQESEPGKGTNPISPVEGALMEARIQILAAIQFLRQQALTVDVDRVKLLVKTFVLKCYSDITTMDKEKAKTIGLRYRGKVVGAAREMRSLDRAKAKAKMQEMSSATKARYFGFTLLVLVVFFFQSLYHNMHFYHIDNFPLL